MMTISLQSRRTSRNQNKNHQWALIWTIALRRLQSRPFIKKKRLIQIMMPTQQRLCLMQANDCRATGPRELDPASAVCGTTRQIYSREHWNKLTYLLVRQLRRLLNTGRFLLQGPAQRSVSLQGYPTWACLARGLQSLQLAKLSSRIRVVLVPRLQGFRTEVGTVETDWDYLFKEIFFFGDFLTVVSLFEVSLWLNLPNFVWVLPILSCKEKIQSNNTNTQSNLPMHLCEIQ